MAGILLTYGTAMAASRDAGNRSMRAGGRAAWSAEDYDAAADKLDRLAVVFYYANEPHAVGPVELPQACFALQQTRGMNCIHQG